MKPYRDHVNYSVSEAATFVGVSARVLRHYDEIGLLMPSGRTAAGYRQYSDDDLIALQRIVSFRDMGMSLDDIARLIASEAAGAIGVLEQQERVLRVQLDRVTQQLAVVTKTRKARSMGVNLNPDEMQEVFGDHDPTQYQEEAQERWGETDAYKESHRRTSKYTKEDWAKLSAESEAIESAFARALAAGLSPESAEAKQAAELHRRQIDTWFYPCSYEMQTGLAEMYVADARFTEHYDKRLPGLAAFVRDAIIANALDHM